MSDDSPWSVDDPNQPLGRQEYYQQPAHTYAAGIGLSVLCVVLTGVRFWIRRLQEQKAKLDDWIIVPATVLTVAMGVLLVYGTAIESLAHRAKIPPGFDKHPAALNTDQRVNTSRLEFLHDLFLPLALGCIKCSFIAFYMRIFAIDKTAKTYRLLLGFNILLAIWTVGFFFATLFACGIHPESFWGDRTIPTKCFDTMKLIYGFCISDLITDVIIIAIPMPLIWNLKLTLQKKIATTSIFLLGAVTIAASLTRVIVTVKILNEGYASRQDEILGVTLYVYWGLVESGVGILASCLPTMSFLLRLMNWKGFTSSNHSIFSRSNASGKHGNTSDRGHSRDMSATFTSPYSPRRFDPLDDNASEQTRVASYAMDDSPHSKDKHRLSGIPPGTAV